MKTMIIGIGNSLLGDDGVGVHIARRLSRLIKDENVDVVDANMGSLNLLDFILGYDKLIIIDAIMTKQNRIGEIYRLGQEKISEPVYTAATSPHHFNLPATIEIGRRLFPSEMPKEVVIYAVGAQDVAQVSEEITDEVKKAIPGVISLVLEEINHNTVV
ncbi:hydrogenase maturation protease [Chloroflexota bacterium]